VPSACFGHFGGIVQGDGGRVFAGGLESEALAGSEGGASLLELFIEGFYCLEKGRVSEAF
jgi:hypothetical protein